MTVSIIANEHRQVAVDAIAPGAQTSNNSESLFVGSEIDARMWRSVAYTIVNADGANTVQWSVYGAHANNYADEVAVQALTDVGPAAAGNYAVAQAPFSYYRAKIKSKVGGSHGACTLRGLAKG